MQTFLTVEEAKGRFGCLTETTKGGMTTFEWFEDEHGVWKPVFDVFYTKLLGYKLTEVGN